MGLIRRKAFKKGDPAILYVTTCSDIDTSFEHSRRFLECIITGKIYSYDKDTMDDRYIVRCAEDIREEPYKGGIYAYEALVSVNSPFLFPYEDFEKYRCNDDLRYRYLNEACDLILGFNVPKHLRNWQNEVCKILLGLGIDDAWGIVDDIREDFVSDKMEIIRFP